MASRLMHLAVAQELIRGDDRFSGTADKTRFLFGSLLPDASTTKASHFPIYAACGPSGERKKTFDLAGFRAFYSVQIRNDPLYLGYYLHLVQEVLFRKLMYPEKDYSPHGPENVSRLYEDYRTIGDWLIRTYGLSAPSMPEGLESEGGLLGLFPFRLSEFRKELERDFLWKETPGQTKTQFLHVEMVSQFVRESVSVCGAEVRRCFEEADKQQSNENLFWWNAGAG
ncbi:MAG: hypothetical protein ILO68_04315 [Clostridia bacterium]|nr:hypothetical protein [Clostridia bacterium]